jgi:hypothetical protein
MLSHVSAGDRWLRHLAFGTVLSLALAGSPSLAAAADQPVIRVVGCNPSSLKSTFQTNVVQATADSADQENDNEAEDGPDSGDAGEDTNIDQQQPAIHGSIALPGVNEDDSKAIAAAIAAKGLSTITPDAATAAAKGALTDAGQRTFKKPVLQTENEQAIWSVETSAKGGVNPSLELKVDAGNGNILAMECD